MRWLLHRLAHLFGRNVGDVVTWWQGERLMVGFRCRGCGKLLHEHEAVGWGQRP